MAATVPGTLYPTLPFVRRFFISVFFGTAGWRKKTERALERMRICNRLAHSFAIEIKSRTNIPIALQRDGNSNCDRAGHSTF
jgi:hypothetical protein